MPKLQVEEEKYVPEGEPITHDLDEIERVLNTQFPCKVQDIHELEYCGFLFNNHFHQRIHNIFYSGLII